MAERVSCSSCFAFSPMSSPFGGRLTGGGRQAGPGGWVLALGMTPILPALALFPARTGAPEIALRSVHVYAWVRPLEAPSSGLSL